MKRRTVTRSHLSKLLILTFVGLIAIASATPTRAFTSAFFPTQSVGNRGTDVKAIQYLLNITADGVFGSGTETAVKNFQASRGLTADGIVGPATWGALVPTIRLGSSGNAVRALQNQLNEKTYAGLPLDGVFNSAVETAVRNYQSHAGLSVDGVVGPTTWKNLIWHYEQPNVGAASLCGALSTAKRWGTAAAMDQIERAASSFYASYGKEVPVGNASLEHGGDIDPHSSHEEGLDVDLWAIRTDNQQCTIATRWDQAGYDRAATRALIQAIRAQAPGHVKAIFFNDPQLINEGLTINVAGHDDHLHVRYCERVHPVSLYVC